MESMRISSLYEIVCGEKTIYLEITVGNLDLEQFYIAGEAICEFKKSLACKLKT